MIPRIDRRETLFRRRLLACRWHLWVLPCCAAVLRATAAFSPANDAALAFRFIRREASGRCSADKTPSYAFCGIFTRVLDDSRLLTAPSGRSQRRLSSSAGSADSEPSDECDLALSSSPPAVESSTSSSLLLEVGGAEYIRVSVGPPHSPLGCTVEESLAPQHAKLVFVSAVKPGGIADQAGLRVGDVIVGVSNVFGELADVTHDGVERVKGWVQCRPDDEPLEFRLARGTRVLEEHERALVELCSRPELLEEDAVEQCVQSFLESTYDDDVLLPESITVECAMVEGVNDDNDDNQPVDCLVDNLYNLWAEELPAPLVNGKPAGGSNGASTASKKRKEVKPWSSRSSPSGTFVRDPATGKLKNLDV